MSNIEKLKKEIKNYKPKSWKQEIFFNQLIAICKWIQSTTAQIKISFIWANPDKI